MVAVPFRGTRYPLLEFVLTPYYEQGLRELIVCLGHLGDQIRNYFGDGSRVGLRIRYSDSGDVGTARRLRDALAIVPDEDVIVACADVHHSLDLGALEASGRSDDEALAVVMLAKPGPADGRPPNVALDAAGRVVDYGWGTAAGVRRGHDVGVMRARGLLAKRLGSGAQASINGDLYPELIRRGELHGLLGSGIFRDVGTPERHAEFCRFVGREGAIPLSLAHALDGSSLGSRPGVSQER